MTPTLWVAIATHLAIAGIVVRALTRRTPPELDLPATWTPIRRTIVQTRHLDGGRSW
jgi:hypothetical protein